MATAHLSEPSLTTVHDAQYVNNTLRILYDFFLLWGVGPTVTK